MNSRQVILTAVARNQPATRPMPTLPEPSIELASADGFAQRVEAIGGTVVPISALTDIVSYVQTRFPPPARLVSTLPDLPLGERLSDPLVPGHTLETVDLALLMGAFGVVENGAIWLDSRHLPHRALPFICQHLALVVSSRALVPTLHDAYRRLSPDIFDYGVFIAGPSKTADIEQSLVIGAHGPRSLTVFLLTTDPSR
ncbi:LUD domain-containing protein [Spirosoma sp. 209]|uniref:LutC/YkgG family protein n=1 Tax=Spirosoma sp. 209 TaxID=1955701 RepID=UPI00137475F6|nr:LUD domain-containing protein [Spirosoma sp. 209]